MKKLLLLCLISLGAKAQDTTKNDVSIYVEPVPLGVTLEKTIDLSGREVPFDTKGLTFWILSDGTVRKYYRL